MQMRSVGFCLFVFQALWILLLELVRKEGNPGLGSFSL